MAEIVNLGAPITAWQQVRARGYTELAGKYVVWFGYDSESEREEIVTLKFHNFYVMHRGTPYCCYIPLPKDKELLKRLLLEVAENEGIDLGEDAT